VTRALIAVIALLAVWALSVILLAMLEEAAIWR